MKSIFTNKFGYLFGIAPLSLIVLLTNLKNDAPVKMQPRAAIKTVANASPMRNFWELPCGFNALGPRQQPAKPTIKTSNVVPVLQYPGGSYLQSPINVPDALNSERGESQLVLQGDGNLVIYCMSCKPVRGLWDSQTAGKGGKTLFFQTDGDLVLKDGNGKVIWHSNLKSSCPGSERAYYTLQDDGNFVMLYDSEPVTKPAASGSSNSASAPPSPGAPSPAAKPASNANVYTYCLGSSGTTNDMTTGPHNGKIK